ncbi:unnamed protein product [Caenorhabditis angaria]|uniref:Uncharacterized protein n=1 Tax=Caenorhabditis angaria TaxID=860376 RepID=A0A9P1IW52_9PELO|nr:unnamed protein product [Caenorhabditis angaria]
MIDAFLNKITAIYYHIYYLAFGIPMNLLMFFMIFKKTAKVFCNIPEKNMEVVYNETFTQHPDYSLEPFGNCGGFVNTYSVFASANTFILAITVVYLSIFGYYCRWSSLKILDLNKTSLSQKNVELFKSLIQGLTVQTILPLACYILVGIFFLHSKYNEQDQLIFSQYLVGILLTLPAVMNPMLNIYFIIPYRVALRQMSLSAAVAVLNSHIIFYRMIFMKFQERKTALKYVYLYCINYLIPLITVIFCNIPEKNMDAVYNETITQHPDYSFEPFGKFGGFVNTYNVFTSANTIILALGTVYFSIIGFYCRWSSLKILDLSKTSLSQKNVDLFKSLIHGFTVQTILPLTCYIPVAISFLYNKYNENDQLIFSQYLVGTLLTLPAVMNPMLNIYFIVPYRVALRRMILLNRSEIESEPRVRFRNNSINPSLHHHECLATVAN